MKIISCNKVLEKLDLRNTGLSLDMRRKFQEFFWKDCKASHVSWPNPQVDIRLDWPQ